MDYSGVAADARRSGEDGAVPGGAPEFDDPEIVGRRMVSSYKAVGSMLLVSSVTTAICFFSNVFSALVSISDFGSYMGMVVVLNYVHVMTILPSAIIVNEVHVKPLQRRMWGAVCPSSKNGGREEPNSAGVVDEGAGIVPSSSIGESSIHEDEEAGENLAETGVTVSFPQSEDAGREDGRDNTTTPESITSSNEEPFREHNEEFQQPPEDDYKFLDHTKEMTILDRYLVQVYAPFVYKWRKTVVFTSLFVAITLGILAWLNFTLYDGTIIVFKEKYNLGRVQRVIVSWISREVVCTWYFAPLFHMAFVHTRPVFSRTNIFRKNSSKSIWKTDWTLMIFPLRLGIVAATMAGVAYLTVIAVVAPPAKVLRQPVRPRRHLPPLLRQALIPAVSKETPISCSCCFTPFRFLC